jgi:hypothetical protein
MKTIRLILLFATLAGLVSLARATERSRVQGILISASNESGETDRRLAPYEPTLRRILRFESFRFLGDGSATLAVSEPGHLSLGNGHELALTTESVEGSAIHVRVRWSSGGRTLMNTGLVLRAGVPAVLGGPATGNKGEVYAVILIGR